MSEGKFLKIVIVVLLLINIGTLGFLFFRRPPHHMAGGQPGGGENPAQYLRRELALTDDQESKFKSIREAHHDQVQALRERMATYRKELYNGMKQPSTNSASSMVWIDSLANTQRQIEQITYAHFTQVRALCTPAQQQKFDDVIAQAVGRLNGPPQGPPPGPDGPPPPGPPPGR